MIVHMHRHITFALYPMADILAKPQEEASSHPAPSPLTLFPFPRIWSQSHTAWQTPNCAIPYHDSRAVWTSNGQALQFYLRRLQGWHSLICSEGSLDNACLRLLYQAVLCFNGSRHSLRTHDADHSSLVAPVVDGAHSNFGKPMKTWPASLPSLK